MVKYYLNPYPIKVVYSMTEVPFYWLCQLSENEISINSTLGEGIFENVNIFLKRVEKGADTLTQEDLDNEENDIEEKENQSEEIETQNISNKLQIEISQIENW
ncbi:hypothetical protein Glove_724g23 [Diversispora epigaea]|uniref:Uncharacterized protein n=1 Tax=Diversispora epigaea TaxID=1348612 RepID=A0A397G4G2_9GLOM|nr:hypothetical protein Glove_724g23 [Diversispora epigaea]